MVTECVVFKSTLVTGIHSLLDERRSDSSTEVFSIFMNRLQFLELLRKNSKEICLKQHKINLVYKSYHFSYAYVLISIAILLYALV